MQLTEIAPAPPMLLTAHAESSTCIELSWAVEHRSNTSHIIAYTAHYSPTAGKLSVLLRYYLYILNYVLVL